MKTEDLQAQGLNEDQIKFVMAENGKDIKKLQKENETLVSDRDAWKGKAETAETTLKGFEGVDMETVKKDLDDWKQKAEQAEKDLKEKLYERDFTDALKAELDGVKFTSEAAKKAITAEVKEAGLKLKDGKILGLSDLLALMKEKDATAFVDEGQKKAQQGAAKFTKPLKVPPAGTKLSPADLMKLKNENPDLDIKAYM